ncbi:hypothetical protein DVH24_037018 [Malus domestica]|uniref:Uncharacterized protein n=1 Tax=Malus domestica TaxID=3750 RepID=A0A498HFY0_MALDO|nr:hypothetical protein DVH24_037018 [Malus domestica]
MGTPSTELQEQMDERDEEVVEQSKGGNFGEAMEGRKKERVVVVECRGHDAARLPSIDHAHGWEEDVVDLVEEQHGKNKVLVSF